MENQNKVVVIAAVGINNEIGFNDELPWRLSADLKNFREKTTNNIIIMGRKTYESIGKALPNRINIVITTDVELTKMIMSENLFFVNSIDQALLKCEKVDVNREKTIYVIGGGKIYEQFLSDKYVDIVDECYLTHVFNDNRESYEGFVFFPEISNKNWKLVNDSTIFPKDEKNEFAYQFATYIKR